MVYTKSLALFLLAVIPFFCDAQQHTIQIHATVAPQRFIIVDASHRIQEITSNSNITVPPTIVLDHIGGIELSNATDILQEYQALTPSLNFSRPGIIYTRSQQVNSGDYLLQYIIAQLFGWRGNNNANYSTIS